MAPYELVSIYGAIDYWQRNEVSGLDWLKRLTGHFSKGAWLNPIQKRYWGHPTIRMISEVFSMHELTLALRRRHQGAAQHSLNPTLQRHPE